MITSKYGPPFNEGNVIKNEWERRKKDIQEFLEFNWVYSKAEVYVRDMLADLWVALKAEEEDNEMYAKNLAVIYDEASGGRISKPNTQPQEVVTALNERLNDQYEDGYRHGYDNGVSDTVREER